MRRFLPILSIMAALMLSACSGGEKNASAGTSESKSVFRTTLGAEPPDLDPTHAADIPSINLVQNLFEPLLRMNNDGTPLPGVATKWTHSDDYTEWTFDLRADAKWSNGDPVVAGDFVYAVERILAPANKAHMAMMVYNFLEGGKEFYDGGAKDPSLLGIKAVDDHTLSIKLAGPTPFLPSLVSHPAWFPIHRGTVEKNGESWSRSAGSYVSNGAFKVSEMHPKNKIVGVRNEFYHSKDEVGFDQIDFLFIEDTNTQIAAYDSGDLDMTGLISNRMADTLMKRDDFSNVPLIGTYFISFNQTRPPFDNVDVRKAFSLAINRRLVVERVTRRGELPSSGFVPHGIAVHTGKDYRDIAPALIGNDDYAANLAAAKAHLAAAGYGPSNPLPRIEYMFNTVEIHVDIAQVLQTQWSTALGAEVDLAQMEWGVLLGRIRSHDFQSSRSSWTADYLDPLTFLEIFETGHEKNGPGYSNAEYDGLLAKIRSEPDADKRLGYIMEAEKILIERDCVVAPLYEYNTPIMLRSDIKGVIQMPTAGVDFSRAWREGE